LGDPDYSPTRYAQLAAALTSAGDRDAADEIRYLGRVRERETQKGLAYVWSGFLQWVAGFGIGTYTFRVLYWVIGISFLGALYLRTRVKGVRDNHRGFIWCYGASLARLLPVIEINKEFTDFFNDPERKRMTDLQSFVFNAMGIVGFVLGAILIAAVSGLMRKGRVTIAPMGDKRGTAFHGLTHALIRFPCHAEHDQCFRFIDNGRISPSPSPSLFLSLLVG
jgi:hypothetical protein